MDLIEADRFWTGVVRIPRVKPAMLEAVLLHEIGKSYPGSVEADADLRWENLDGLFGGSDPALQAYLVQIPLAAGLSGLSGLQCLVRQARRGGGAGFSTLAVLSPAGVEVLGTGQAGLEVYRVGGWADIAIMVADLAPGPLLCLRLSPGLEISGAGRECRYLEAGDLAFDRLTREPLRNDGRSRLVLWRRLAISGGAACLLLLGAWAWRLYADRQAQTGELRGQVMRMQQVAQATVAGSQERLALEKDVDALKQRAPVDVYHLLQSVIEHMDDSDRILMVRWDGESRTMSLELVSKQAIALLDRLSNAGLFAKLSSGGMAPLEGDPSSLRFTMTATLEAP